MTQKTKYNVNPTFDDVREWGFDEELTFIQQDEDAIIGDLYYMPVLLELAQNPACPKRRYILAIMGQFARVATLYRLADDLDGLEKIANSFQSDDHSIKDWQNYVNRLLSYQRTPFPVLEQKAWIMAHDLLIGIGRIGQIRIQDNSLPDAWQFLLVTSLHEHLSITRQTGVYSYRREYP